MIGIFDSGIGGLTVVRSIMGLFPDSDICYFGDTARTPYGTKSPETVRQYAVENTELLLERGAKLVVCACNSASSVGARTLQETFDVPMIEVITPAVARAAATPKCRAVGVIGTRATVGSGVYEAKIGEIAPQVRVYSRACPLLVPLVEEGWLNRPETRMIVKKYLHPLKTRQVDALILGCTHYPVLKDMIARRMGKRVRIIDSSVAVAGSLRDLVEEKPEFRDALGRSGNLDILVSDVTDQFARVARLILQRPVELKHVRL
ncbi:MAG: glutamate racemase [Desulfatibacillaceae bacterium]